MPSELVLEREEDEEEAASTATTGGVEAAELLGVSSASTKPFVGSPVCCIKRSSEENRNRTLDFKHGSLEFQRFKTIFFIFKNRSIVIRDFSIFFEVQKIRMCCFTLFNFHGMMAGALFFDVLHIYLLNFLDFLLVFLREIII